MGNEMPVLSTILVVAKDRSVIAPSSIMNTLYAVLKELGVVTELPSNEKPYFNRIVKMDFLDQCMIGRYDVYIPRQPIDGVNKQDKVLGASDYEDRTLNLYFSEYKYDDQRDLVPQPIRVAKNFVTIHLNDEGIAVEFLKKLSAALTEKAPELFVYTQNVHDNYSNIYHAVAA